MVVVVVHRAGVRVHGLVALVRGFVGRSVVIITVPAMPSVTLLPPSPVALSSPSLHQHLTHPVIVPSAPAAVIVIAIIAVIAVTVTSVTLLVPPSSKGGGEQTSKKPKEGSRG